MPIRELREMNLQRRSPVKDLESYSLLPHIEKIEESGGETLYSELVTEKNKIELFLYWGCFCMLWNFRTHELNLVLGTAAWAHPSLAWQRENGPKSLLFPSHRVLDTVLPKSKLFFPTTNVWLWGATPWSGNHRWEGTALILSTPTKHF